MNPRVGAISTSLIRQVASRKRPTSIDLGLGEPSLMPNIAHFEAAMLYVRERGTRYTANAGDPELRDAIARHYAYPGLERAENVCVTVGSQEAMYATLLTLFDAANDELLIVEPAFPSYAKMAALHGVAARGVAMSEAEDFAIDADRIVDSIGERTRAIVLCSPCNPTGRAISADQAASLARVLERRGGAVALIHDEIYREQHFGERVDLARLYANTIAVNSLSKSNALTGLRLGWILAPEAFIVQAIKVHAWLTSCTDVFAQHVALHVFATAALEEHGAWYRERQPLVVAALRESGLRFIAPDGGFYACVRLRDGMESLPAALALADERDVIAIPGIAFGACFEGWLRLSWVAPLDDFCEGLARIAAFC
ncbi:MAG TPA: pyridoxal phosphate-dependent aminotransferase [Candidatus Tyrphobacter sp.]